MTKTIHVLYYSILKDVSNLSDEKLLTTANTASDLYDELTQKYQFSITKDMLRVAVNEEFQEWSVTLNDGDVIVFIPPVSGG
jgi:sulfur-carrier protein